MPAHVGPTCNVHTTSVDERYTIPCLRSVPCDSYPFLCFLRATCVRAGSIAAKLVLPQDPVIGWLTRGIPLLTVPLHAVFILAVGQMFADWWVCMGCVCFMIGDGAVTYFGSAIPAAYATFHAPMKFVKKAKLKGTLCMLLGVIFMFMGLTTNDLISTSMPEVSFNVDVNVSSLLHTVIIFVAKFMISKNLMTIIFSDCVISLVFSINTELQNQDLQRPYQHEVRLETVSRQSTALDLCFIDSIVDGRRIAGCRGSAVRAFTS